MDGRKLRGYAANKQTTCGFVKNVLEQMDRRADELREFHIEAASDATGKKYKVQCAPVQQGGFLCKGGDNAAIHLIPR